LPAAKKKPQQKRAPAKRPASRRSRAEELRKAAERRRTRIRMVATSVVLAIIGAIAISATVNSRNGDANGNGTGTTVPSASCKGDPKYDGESRAHVANPTYKVNPPAGGAHTPQAALPGFYHPGDKAPSDGELVHAMEHGFIVLWYRPDLSPEDMRAIATLSDRFGRELIVVPRASLPPSTPVVVTAWHHRLLCSAIDAEAIASFVEKYRDKGPEKGFL
jgi:hypothetical protein